MHCGQRDNQPAALAWPEAQKSSSVWAAWPTELHKDSGMPATCKENGYRQYACCLLQGTCKQCELLNLAAQIMPVDTVGFTIKPVGFFASNPTLDVPPHINRMSKLHPCCPALHTPRVSDAGSAADLDRARRRSSSNRVFTTSQKYTTRMSEPGLAHELTSIPERSESDLTATLKRMWDTMQRVTE